MSSSADTRFMTRALELAAKGRGFTSPNPCVGAVMVQGDEVIGEGWHRRAGGPHAEIEALNACIRSGHSTVGATLYVTLEPCCSHGRTPPCTDAILAAGIGRVVVAATDPNPAHAGRGFRILRRQGVKVTTGVLQPEAIRLNEGFNHWIVQDLPFVTAKAGLTLDGRIATASGDSRWVTGEAARRHAMNQLRRDADGIVAGINTILADDPLLTYRGPGAEGKSWRRIILDSRARTPLHARVLNDDARLQTTIVVTGKAPARRVDALRQRANVLVSPARQDRVDLPWLMRELSQTGVTSLLVEGGGEVIGSFLNAGLVQRIAFYYAPKILGGRNSRPGVGGADPQRLADAIELHDVEQLSFGKDFLVTGLIRPA